MKSILPILALLVLASCTKTEIKELNIAEEKICELVGKAEVKLMQVNEDGTEFFYYLQFFDVEGNDLEAVFPKDLPVRFEKVGEKVEVSYNSTKEKQTYIVCLAGHQIDPSNPDIRKMPIIEICEAKSLP